MPYTQAYPLRDSVDKALQAKIDLLKKRGREGSDIATYYFTNRAPWITMTSAVDIVGDEERRNFNVDQASQLAKDYKLTSGYEQGDLPAGHSLSQELGIRPRPGIQSMNITSHNQFGSLRTAKVNFQVWSKEDLDACEVLYMRPGMSVLLEWGWSLYLKGEGENITVHPMERGYDLFNTKNRTLIDMLKDLEDLKTQRGYGYDAIFGFVKNFSWKVRPDGGYDCSTDIVSPGELVESLNVFRPLSDNDADLYQKYFEKLAEVAAEKADNAPSSAPAASFNTNTRLGASLGQQSVANYELQQIKKQLTKEALDIKKEIVKFSEQNSIYTILGWDFLKIVAKEFEKEFGDEAKNKVGVYRYNFASLPTEARLSRRLYEKSSHKNQYQNLLLVNWNNPQYGLDDTGQIDKGQVVQGTKQQYYVKLGYLFELLNEFFVQTGQRGVINFDTIGRTTFNKSQEFMLSLDPSVCILPGDFANIQLNHKIQTSADQNESIFVNPFQYQPTAFEEEIRGISMQGVSGPDAPIEEEPIEDGTTILETYINVDYILQLLDDNQINQNTKNGIPVARMFNMVQGILSGINAACAGLCELDLQYYEHEGLYSVIDRQHFSKAKKSPTFLDVLGLGSLFYSHNISSALTPELASSIAISAQASVTSTDSTAAGFLRFNHGLQDRVLKDKNLTSSVVNPEETYISTEEDKQRVRDLYSELYGALGWAAESFRYARELYHQYINEKYVQGNDTYFSRVVIPFIASFDIDGMSGFRILNSFRVDEKLLPYSYNYIKGGIGMVATGLEATVDPSKWVTKIKAQMYPLASGTLPVSDAITPATPEEDSLTNIIVEYSDQVQELDILRYLNLSVGEIVKSDHLGTYEKQKPLQDLVDDEYGRWKLGTRTEIEDRGGQDINVPPDEFSSNQRRYWDNMGVSWSEWIYGTTKDARGKTVLDESQTLPWSAAYVSYIMNNGFNGANDPLFTKASAHWKYAKTALDNRLAGKTYGGWVLFSLKHDAAKYPIAAEVGDIVLNPRKGGYTASHGRVVFYVLHERVRTVDFDNVTDEDFNYEAPYGQAILAGGNESNTNKITTLRLDNKIIKGKKHLCYPENISDVGELVVLKRF